MTDREIFKRNLSNIINEAKVKQQDIAKYAEVSYQTVSAWVTGRGYPRPEAMRKLCRFFGVPQSALTEEDKKEETPEEKLIDIYYCLPDEGREKLIQRAEELLILYPKRRRNNGKIKKGR